MSANPVPQTPVEPPVEPSVEPTVAPAPTAHERHIGTIAAWLTEKSGEDLVVEVVIGPKRNEIARGRYVGMEAHPSAKGVYRLAFDKSRAGPDTLPGEPWVAVGGELMDVAAGDTSLILDKGSQRVEVHVLDALPAAAPVAEVEAPAPPVTVHDDRTASATVKAPSLIEAYAPGLEAVATAPFYQNSAILASSLFGETKVGIVEDEVHVTARRMRHGTPFFVLTGIVLAAFALAGVMLYMIVLFGLRSGGGVTQLDVEYLDYTRNGTLAIAGAALVFYLIGRVISAGKQPERIVVLLTQVWAKSYRRFVILRGPFGRKGRRRKLVLKPAGKAEHERLDKLVDVIRAQRRR